MTIYTLVLYVGLAAAALTAVIGYFKRPQNWVALYLQQFVGALFIWSGLVKAVDPVGTSYKMHEYFADFGRVFASPLNAIFPVLAEWSLAFGIFMIVLEIVLGIQFVLGLARKWSSWLFLGIVVFFTLLTGYTYLSGFSQGSMSFMLFAFLQLMLISLAVFTKSQKIRYASMVTFIVMFPFYNYVFNFLFAHGTDNGGNAFDYRWDVFKMFEGWEYDTTKMRVTDCGCFGDFLKLEPKVSFFKDLVLLVPGILFAFRWDLLTTAMDEKGTVSRIVTGLAWVGTFIFCLMNFYWDEPMVDFRPFQVGVNIPYAKKNTVPDSIQSVYVMKDTLKGTIKEANNMDEYMALFNAGYKYQDRKDVLIKKGNRNKLNEFALFNEDGLEMTDSIEQNKKGVFLVVAYDLNKTAEKAFSDKINPLAAAAEKEGLETYVGYSAGDANAFRTRLQCSYPFLTGDDKMLETILRANPGVVLIKGGTIVNKWHWKKLPDYPTIKAKHGL